MKDEHLLQQEANRGSTWGWLFLMKSQEQQVRLPCIQLLLYSAKFACPVALLILPTYPNQHLLCH